MTETTIGVDLGGTRIKAVAIDTDGKVLQQVYKTTSDGADGSWKNALEGVVREIMEGLDNHESAVGISAPGLPNSCNTAIAYMPGRLQGLENFDWGKFLGVPAYVLNDAIAAMLAEARLGAARNRRNVVMLTLGTGVGGAILIDGRPYQGAFNKAGHLGHMVIDSDGERDITGIPGSLEDAIGNCTIEKRSHGKFTSTKALLEAYRSGSFIAAEIWLTSVKKLAAGIASITNILSPEVVVLGGGITEAGSDLFDPLHAFMGVFEWRAGGNRVEITKAMYGDLAGAVGAACFAKEYSHDFNNQKKIKQ